MQENKQETTSPTPEQTKLDDLLGPPVHVEPPAVTPEPPASAEAVGPVLTPAEAAPITATEVNERRAAHDERLVEAGERAQTAIAEALASGALPLPAVTQEAPAVPVEEPAQPKPAKRKATHKKRKTGPKKKSYEPLKKPRNPAPHGLFELKAKAGGTLGHKCVICKQKLKYKSGRPPIICRKIACFRASRNAYRRDYTRAQG
jgi:hypothetical protein